MEAATPLIAIAAAREVVDDASRFLGEPLPATYAAGLAARALIFLRAYSTATPPAPRCRRTLADFLPTCTNPSPRPRTSV